MSFLNGVGIDGGDAAAEGDALGGGEDEEFEAAVEGSCAGNVKAVGADGDSAAAANFHTAAGKLVDGGVGHEKDDDVGVFEAELHSRAGLGDGVKDGVAPLLDHSIAVSKS